MLLRPENVSREHSNMLTSAILYYLVVLLLNTIFRCIVSIKKLSNMHKRPGKHSRNVRPIGFVKNPAMRALGLFWNVIV